MIFVPEIKCQMNGNGQTTLIFGEGCKTKEKRPLIDIKKVKKMLERRSYCPDIRHSDDRAANGGSVSLSLLTEYKQKYIEMHFKHANGAPCPYCLLCGQETWSASHMFSAKHLEELLTRPY